MERNCSIPKIIHYAWFGRGEKTRLAKRCIASWKEKLPDYELREWNEDNFDLHIFPYAEDAYIKKKYAYVTDVVRLYALYHYGGIYMDTDVEVVRSMDNLLGLEAFSGFQTRTTIPTGTMGARREHPWVKEQLNYYSDRKFDINVVNDKKLTNVDVITELSIEKHGLIPNGKKQELKYGMVMFPMDYFCAKDLKTGKVKITKNTYTIHHFAGSWVPKRTRFHRYIYQILNRTIGENRTENLMNQLVRKG